MRLRLALAVWLVGLGGAAHADVLGSGALFASGQSEASCTVTNVSSSAGPVGQVRIFSSDGSPVSVPFQNCQGVALAPGRTCNLNANLLSQTLLYSCQVDTGGANGLRFRGTLIIYDSSKKILGTSDLR